MEKAARTMKSGHFFCRFFCSRETECGFCVFGRSLLDVPKEELRNRKVLGTYFAGRRFVRKKRSVAALFASTKNHFTAKAFN